jgi:23S rRNA (cytosine1962-C5)-methyltransferase
MSLSPDLITLIGDAWDDYGLIDSGHGRKLERYGEWRFIRPEPQAMWAPASADWQADGEFVPASDDDGGGRWYFERDVPTDGWPLAWRDVQFTAQCTPFRHLGFFPDMAPVWDWLTAQIARSISKDAHRIEPPRFLNLFGYTGVGSCALAKAGCDVVHVDASKKSVAQARENAVLAGLGEAPIRWLVDDAVKFTAREVRRGRRYDAILLDPPKFGRGPDGERWQLEADLPGLLARCRQLMDANSRALFLTVYAVRMSALALGELLQQLFADLPGTVECGELTVREEARGLLLPTAIWARWSRD